MYSFLQSQKNIVTSTYQTVDVFGRTTTNGLVGPLLWPRNENELYLWSSSRMSKSSESFMNFGIPPALGSVGRVWRDAVGVLS